MRVSQSALVNFSLDQFVADARQAAAAPNALEMTDRLMSRLFSSPEMIRAGVPDMAEDEVNLFEDDTVSIWHERFLPSEELPPHDHQLPAVIGVYHGAERNRLFRKAEGCLIPGGELILRAGQTHVFGPNDVHTVQALEGAPSLGLHIYLGPLTRVERSLFEWETGASVPMSDAAFNAMKRSVPAQ